MSTVQDTPCSKCGASTGPFAKKCLHCGHFFSMTEIRLRRPPISKGTKRTFWTIAVVLIAFSGLLIAKGGGSQSTSKLARSSASLGEKLQGMHCLNQWDGAHPEFKRATKEMLQYPESFEHESTYVSPVSGGTHVIRMKFRSRNAFGQVVQGIAQGAIDHRNCSVLGLTLT